MHDRRRSGRGGRSPQRPPSDSLRPALPPLPKGPLPITRFEAFGLPRPLLDGLSAAAYVEPTEVQERMIPLVLEGRNVVARSRTGTGKTCAYLVPTVARLEETRLPAAGRVPPRGPPRILVVVPTRELAVQVAAEADRLLRFLPIRTTCLYGGRPLRAQIADIGTSAVLVGTPGRLLDHLRRRTLDPSTIRTLVLDEVDRMYDLGFREDVDRILAATAGRAQTLLLSATFTADVERLIARHVKGHATIEVESKTLTVDEVEQQLYVAEPERKMDLLVAILKDRDPRRTIVFVRTKISADRLARRLRDQGFPAQEIHSGLQQRRREQILADFREGRFSMLVATDVAARGLDIRGVTHVVNYDVPENPEDYVHRVGRTARMGEEGWAITLVAPDDGIFITAIEKLISRELHLETFPGFEKKPVAPKEKPATPAAPRPPSTALPSWDRPARRRRR